jgi:nitrile hydratase accessory protein
LSRPEAPFEEPWQAQLFALTVALSEAGEFTWPEWAEVFGPRVKGVGGDQYWQTWSEALVVLLESRGIAQTSDIIALTQRWQAAARATPHGKPILLSAAD